jgi:hypothetical protein
MSGHAARKEFEGWAEANVVARVVFDRGRWVTKELGVQRPIAMVTS